MVAALANPQTRTVWARLALGQDLPDAVAGLPAARARQVVAALRRAGLIIDGPDGGAVVSETAFADLLCSAARPPRTGVDRFLRDGRVESFPTTQRDRHELFAWVASQVLEPGEEVDEKEVNARLANYYDDVARLRRSLVDSGLLERARDGSVYALPATDPVEH